MNINELNSAVCGRSSAGRTERWIKKNKFKLMFQSGWTPINPTQYKLAVYLPCACYQGLAKWRTPYPLSSGNSKSIGDINVQVIMTAQGYAFLYRKQTQSGGEVGESTLEDVTASPLPPDIWTDSPGGMNLRFNEGWHCECTITRTPNFPRKSRLYPFSLLPPLWVELYAPQRYVQVLTSSSCECGLIWK